MNNVELFFNRYEAEPALRKTVADALAAYPGSLELRESVVEYVLLPIAANEGFPFTLKDLRAYETGKKIRNFKEDTPVEEGVMPDDPPEYWLLDYGWEWDDTKIRKRDALLRDIAGI